MMVSRLEQAVSLYRGHYLADLDYPWLIPDQEKLKHACIAARLRLAGYYLEAPDYARAIAHLQTAEEYSPFDEEVHGLLMTAYARQGNRPAAKRQYQKLAAVLKSELGLSPSPAIRELCRKLVE
jgi:two-component SAPR family response regulator